MKVTVICSSDYMAIPALYRLKAAGMLAAVIIPAKYKERLYPSLVQSGIDEGIIYSVGKSDLEGELLQIIKHTATELVCVITFPWKIPASVIAAPEKGVLNFHGGILPKYKGADPVFWQLKNREAEGGFTVHYMTDVIDEGPVLLIEKMPVIQGETYGIHTQRLGILAGEIILKVTSLVQNVVEPKVLQCAKNLYFNKPEREQITINWQQQTAAEIEALVNACNPRYNGAITHFRQIQLSIMEVEFAEVKDVPADTVPGTIVYADGLYGLIVACISGEFLKINIVHLFEGYITGSKLFRMGYRIGEIFY